MYNNFTNGIEYYYNAVTDKCELYGLNLWMDWCYGSLNNQQYLQSVMVGTEVADVWGSSVFAWTNTRDTCVPISMTRIDSGEVSFYYNFKAGAPEDSAFVLPKACVRAEAELKSKEDLKPAPAHHHEALKF